MRRDEALAGVCLVRAEVQGDHVLIAVTTSKGSRSARPDRARHYVDPNKALAAVADFLSSFSKGSEPPRPAVPQREAPDTP